MRCFYVMFLTIVHYAIVRFRILLHYRSASVSPEIKSAVREIKRNGFYCVENYKSADWCANTRTDIDKLLVENPDAVHDHKSADKRIFFAENVLGSAQELSSDPFIHQVVEGYFKTEMVPFMTLAAKLLPARNNPGSGGGWHYDSFFCEVKAFLYLSDVGKDCGPLQLVPHSSGLLSTLGHVWKANRPFRQNRFTDEDFDKAIVGGKNEIVEVCKPSGTLILADVATLHRGKPNSETLRYALTSYFIEKYNHTEKNLAKFMYVRTGNGQAAARRRNIGNVGRPQPVGVTRDSGPGLSGALPVQEESAVTMRTGSTVG